MALMQFPPFEKMKRNRTEIYIDVLKAIKDGLEKPTRIMYRSNLSWRPLKRILDELVRLGLVERKTIKPRNGSRERAIYTITEKGLRVVQKAKELENELMYAFMIPTKRSSIDRPIEILEEN